MSSYWRTLVPWFYRRNLNDLSFSIFLSSNMRNFYIVYPLSSSSNSRNEQRIYENTVEGTYYNVFNTKIFESSRLGFESVSNIKISK